MEGEKVVPTTEPVYQKIWLIEPGVVGSENGSVDAMKEITVGVNDRFVEKIISRGDEVKPFLEVTEDQLNDLIEAFSVLNKKAKA